MNHTPGPWNLSVTGTICDNAAEWDVVDASGVVATVVSVNEADARLIAIAPELLAIAKGLLALEYQCKTHGLSMLVFNARAAIAKATGEAA